LIPKAIKFLKKQYNVNPENIHIGIVPHLFKKNRRFENIEDLDLKKWNGFIEKKDNYFYPDETGLAIKQYKDTGIPDENIQIYDIDTYESAKNGETFSYKYHLEMQKQGIEVPDGRNILAVMKR